MHASLPRRVWGVVGDAELGPVAQSLFLHGLGQGMVIPLLALWITRAYHRGPGAVAAYFACMALGGLVINPLLGRLSDHIGRRRGTAAFAAFLQAAAAVVLALRPPLAVVLLAAALLFSAQVQPHLFALVDDHVGAGDDRRPRGFTLATLRAMISAAWVIGAPLGGWLSGSGFAAVFGVAAALQVASALQTLARCREQPGAHAERRRAAANARARWWPLTLFGLATMAAVAGNTTKLQTVPLYLAHLGLTPTLAGLVFAWMALGEMLLMPPVGRLADRFPRRRLLTLGTLGGTVFFAVLAAVPHVLAVIAVFPFVSFFIAALYGVGIGYAQDIDPAHPGLAGGIFFAAQGVGQALGGPMIAVAQAHVGLPAAFAVPALATAMGAGGMLLSQPAREVAGRRGPVLAPTGVGSAP